MSSARPTRRLRDGRGAAFWPPFVVAVLLLPTIIAFGRYWPNLPATIDLDIYRLAVQDLFAGRDIYQTRSPGWGLTFIYPPIAALIMAPLLIGPYWLWQLLWTAGSVAAQQYVIARCSGLTGWRLGLVGAGCLIAVEPIRTTLGYGQINTILMFLVVADLLGRTVEPNRRFSLRRPPAGLGIGLGTAIKLTPALFAVFALAIGRWKITATAFLSFLVLTAIGAAAQPAQTVAFWSTLLTGDTRAPSTPIYVGNQSLLGVTARLIGEDRTTTLLSLAAGAIVALLAVFVARQLWLQQASRADRAVAIGLVGLATCLASPLSWTHHHVWVVPLAIGLLTGATLPTWARWAGLAWSVWLALGLPLAVLPYGDRREVAYVWWQEIIANSGPLLGCALIVGLAISTLRRRASAKPTAAPLPPFETPISNI